MQIVAARVARMEGDVRSWGARLHKLRMQGHSDGGQPSFDYHKLLDDIEAKCDAAETKLDELKAAGSTRWETLKTDIETAWSEVEVGFRRLAN
jgi:hypothetical protein